MAFLCRFEKCIRLNAEDDNKSTDQSPTSQTFKHLGPYVQRDFLSDQ